MKDCKIFSGQIVFKNNFGFSAETKGQTLDYHSIASSTVIAGRKIDASHPSIGQRTFPN